MIGVLTLTAIGVGLLWFFLIHSRSFLEISRHLIRSRRGLRTKVVARDEVSEVYAVTMRYSRGQSDYPLAIVLGTDRSPLMRFTQSVWAVDQVVSAFEDRGWPVAKAGRVRGAAELSEVGLVPHWWAHTALFGGAVAILLVFLLSAVVILTGH